MKNKNVINTFEMEFPITWSTIIFEQMNRINIFFFMTEMNILPIYEPRHLFSLRFATVRYFPLINSKAIWVSLFGYAVK